MTPLEMIAEWRRSCSNAPKDMPQLCPGCTVALIDALERVLTPVRVATAEDFGIDDGGRE